MALGVESARVFGVQLVKKSEDRWRVELEQSHFITVAPLEIYRFASVAGLDVGYTYQKPRGYASLEPWSLRKRAAGATPWRVAPKL